MSMQQGRYEIMRNYMPKLGTLGLDMMFRTCTVQVNLDFSSQANMIRKFRADLALQLVRLKKYLEMRGADGGPWRRLCALPAFCVFAFLICKCIPITNYSLGKIKQHFFENSSN
ncbi:hypothetical protein F0562_033083 [Nyssa sinensis]|uniref:glutamate--cysteine ligase n=1 Tax=Nyssa sinensis TaxID=561372 RepID=A0A5J5ASY8_9ASTE|nr:hypothetical protein F0562_033083 [Nyssa sinensis]